MGRRRAASSSARRLIAMLAAVALLPSALLVWFGVRMLEQDRELVAQRDFERRQAAAPAIVASLERALSDTERELIGGRTPAGGVRLELTARTASVEPRTRAAWLPMAPHLPETPDAPFRAAETVEQRNLTAAFREYEALAKSPDAAVRAGALLRLARVARRLDRLDQALAAYRAMVRLDRVAVLGAPADLQGRRWSIEILQQLGRRDDARRESEAIERDLLAHRWPLDGGTWGLVTSALRDITGRAVVVPDAARLVSEFADALVRERADARVFRTRRLLESGQAKALAIVTSSPEKSLGLILDQSVVASWLGTAVEVTPRTGASVRLFTAAGDMWAGPPPARRGGPVAVTSAESGLPWTVAIDSGDISDLEAAFSGRRTLFAASLALVVATLGVATFLVWRTVRREMEIARLQTDFVAAVSHEFRTPLTSLRHVTDLLEENDALAPERKSQFYRTLGRNTERLHRLVEALLDFSRMETGRRPYELRPTDVSALASQVVEEFRHDVGPEKASVTFQNGGPATARADGQSLSTALWNLLDNAVKYSPERAAIDVAVAERADGKIAVSVTDKGLGIPAEERDAIFGRFVRGADAGRLGIKGTGLGLALVSHIVTAHDGRVELESVVGQGSTFTILLPSEVHISKVVEARKTN
jgi:signal transduction histidine kinase